MNERTTLFHVETNNVICRRINFLFQGRLLMENLLYRKMFFWTFPKLFACWQFPLFLLNFLFLLNLNSTGRGLHFNFFPSHRNSFISSRSAMPTRKKAFLFICFKLFCLFASQRVCNNIKNRIIIRLLLFFLVSWVNSIQTLVKLFVEWKTQKWLNRCCAKFEKVVETFNPYNATPQQKSWDLQRSTESFPFDFLPSRQTWVPSCVIEDKEAEKLFKDFNFTSWNAVSMTNFFQESSKFNFVFKWKQKFKLTRIYNWEQN